MSDNNKKNEGETLLAKYAKQSVEFEKKNEEDHGFDCPCGCGERR